MQIAAVAVSATDLSRAVAFYEGLGFAKHGYSFLVC